MMGGAGPKFTIALHGQGPPGRRPDRDGRRREPLRGRGRLRAGRGGLRRPAGGGLGGSRHRPGQPADLRGSRLQRAGRDRAGRLRRRRRRLRPGRSGRHRPICASTAIRTSRWRAGGWWPSFDPATQAADRPRRHPGGAHGALHRGQRSWTCRPNRSGCWPATSAGRSDSSSGPAGRRWRSRPCPSSSVVRSSGPRTATRT